MGISGLSGNFGFYDPQSKQRIRQDGLAVSEINKVKEVTDLQRTSKNSDDEQSRLSLSHYRSHTSDINQLQRYVTAESVNDANISRENGMDRYSLYAINAYQRTENQEKRDQIEKMLGFDLYV